MSRLRNDPPPAVLDIETWEVPFQLSEDDVFLQVGADRRADCRPAEEREDGR